MNYYLVVTLLVVGIAAVASCLRVLVQLHIPLALLFLLVIAFCMGGLEAEGFPPTKKLPTPVRAITADIYLYSCEAGDFVRKTIVTAIADSHPQ